MVRVSKQERLDTVRQSVPTTTLPSPLIHRNLFIYFILLQSYRPCLISMIAPLRYTPFQTDVHVFSTLSSAPNVSSYPHVARWYTHTKSYEAEHKDLAGSSNILRYDMCIKESESFKLKYSTTLAISPLRDEILRALPGQQASTGERTGGSLSQRWDCDWERCTGLGLSDNYVNVFPVLELFYRLGTLEGLWEGFYCEMPVLCSLTL
jgi:hypothetical protein